MFETERADDGTYNVCIRVDGVLHVIAYGYQSIAAATDEIITVMQRILSE